MSVSDEDFDMYEAGWLETARCYDCGLHYGDPGFADLVVPHAAWNKRISPRAHEDATDDPGGVLCPTCMVRAAAKAGIMCKAVFKSGPFSMESSAPAEREDATEAHGAGRHGRQEGATEPTRASESGRLQAPPTGATHDKPYTLDGLTAKLHEITSAIEVGLLPTNAPFWIREAIRQLSYTAHPMRAPTPTPSDEPGRAERGA